MGHRTEGWDWCWTKIQQSECWFLALHANIESHEGSKSASSRSSRAHPNMATSGHLDGWAWRNESWRREGVPVLSSYRRIFQIYLWAWDALKSVFLPPPVKGDFSMINLFGNHTLFVPTTSFQNPSALLFGSIFCHHSGQRPALCLEISFTILISS